MVAPENTTETSILEIFGRFLQRSEHQLTIPNLARGAVVMFTNQVRIQLAKIYGKDAPELAMFPPVPERLEPALVHSELSKRVDLLRQIMTGLRAVPQVSASSKAGKRIFIGHGRSPLWRELKDFITERLALPYDEFNREAVAGYATSERLHAMLSQAAVAFLIMTAEEEHAGGGVHARPNVIHEAGLFQGALGFHRAIVMLEEGCSEFSNIVGLSQIRFPRHHIAASFEEVRRVLEREKLIEA